ncbi:hypothetical protein [Halomonas mongoliensis]|uniref:hypothetical protein n=1 Tax=Halomonas mongoliensis TaxID=321265 RepID=UPI00403AB9A4
MKPGSWLTLTSLGMLLLLPATAMDTVSPHSRDSDNHMIRIDITGTPGTRFSGTLTLDGNNGLQVHPLEGTAPSHRQYSARGVTLELIQQDEGSLTIEIHGGGNRSTSRVSGQGSRVRLTIR